MEKKANKYVILVSDRREGTYAYRGVGTQEEITTDVNVLITEKRVPPRRIGVVPVKGEPRTTETTTKETPKKNNTGKTVGISLAVISAGCLIWWGWTEWKKRKKNKKKK